MFSSIQLIFILIIAYSGAAAHHQPKYDITIPGSVYCDVCHDHTRSHFLQGVDVNIECRFKTTKHVSFSVNKTTDMYGIYKLHIHCSQYPTNPSLMCRATLIRHQIHSLSDHQYCNVTSTNHTSNMIITKRNNVYIFALLPLSYKPLTRNAALCGINSFNSSKFFFPPFVFIWPPLPPLPPFPSFPLPWPYPYYQWSPNPPSLPFPFPPLPPVINLGDPRTWIPNIPFSPPPPQQLPPDPRTWMIPYPPPMNPTRQNP